MLDYKEMHIEADIFFLIKKVEIQDYAKKLIGRELDEAEYNGVRKMFEFGNDAWGEVLKSAIEERTLLNSFGKS